MHRRIFLTALLACLVSPHPAPRALAEGKQINLPPDSCKRACEALKKSCPKSCKNAETPQEQKECVDGCPEAVKNCESTCPAMERRVRMQRPGSVPNDAPPPAKEGGADPDSEEPPPRTPPTGEE